MTNIVINIKYRNNSTKNEISEQNKANSVLVTLITVISVLVVLSTVP